MELKKQENKKNEFIIKHQKIVSCKAKVELSFWEFCKALEEMHSSKLYKVGGYSKFEEYTLKHFGIKKSYAYDCISYAKKRTEEFSITNGNIGITKLLLLNGLSTEEAEAFIQEHDIQDITAKEIKRTIAKLKEQIIDVPADFLKPTIEIVKEVNSYSNYSELIRSKRLDHGYSRQELASLIELSCEFVRKLERGKRRPSMQTIQKIEVVLELSTEETEFLKNDIENNIYRNGGIPEEAKRCISNNEALQKLIQAISSSNIPVASVEEFLRKNNIQ